MVTLFDYPEHANPELAERDRVLDAHEISRGQILDELRGRMRELYRQRVRMYGSDAYVTADDARAVLESCDRYPGPDQLNRNFLGALFLTREWVFTGGRIKSRTPGSHGNELKCWRLEESAR